MTSGKRMRYFRKRKNMTQWELGVACGFPDSNAEIRIAQYETKEGRTPKGERLQALSAALDVSPKAITLNSIDTPEDLLHMLFALEDLYGFQIDKIGSEYVLRVNPITNLDPQATKGIQLWAKMADAMKKGLISKDAYDNWRYHFSEDSIEGYKQSNSKKQGQDKGPIQQLSKSSDCPCKNVTAKLTRQDYVAVRKKSKRF